MQNQLISQSVASSETSIRPGWWNKTHINHLWVAPLTLAMLLGTPSCSPTNSPKGLGSEISSQDVYLSQTRRTSRRIALVIGNGKYKTAPLSTSTNDAVAMGMALRALGFDVTLRTDIDRRQLRASIREFGALLSEGNTGLFYYSGHGMQVDGRNYMIPIDAAINSESDVEDDGVAMNSVLVRMEAASSNPNIIILDACRDNPFEKRFKSVQKGLAPIGAPSGTLIAYATAPGAVADSGPRGGNSPFTAALLQEIGVPASSAWETFNRTARRVLALTGGLQKPHIEITAFPDFSFKALPDGDGVNGRRSSGREEVPIATTPPPYTRPAAPQDITPLSPF